MADSRVTALVDRQAAGRDRISANVLAQVQRVLAGFDGWYDPQLVNELVASLAAAVRAGQIQTASLTDAYLTQVLTVMTGGVVAGTGVRLPESLRGVPLEQAYGRTAETFRYLVSVGASPLAAAAQARMRALVMADTDMTLAMREASRQVFDANDVDGYRRVIRPEKARGGTCGLCLVASDRIYYRQNLLPIHGRCGCETLPIVDGEDPGRSLNRGELDMLYSAAGGTTAGADLKKVRVAVHEHGELGPVLSAGDHNFRGPSDLPG